MARFLQSWALWGGHATRQQQSGAGGLLLMQARVAHSAARPPPALKKLLVANRWVVGQHTSDRTQPPQPPHQHTRC
jgi:hypothetical protein